MRYFKPDSSELTGGTTNVRSVDAVPTGMDNDPNADEEVINQDANEQYPEPIDSSTDQDDTTEPAKLAPDNLADSIAYALDGSGPGPMNEKPNVSGHDVITEGTTGAGPEEEERIFGD
ncbi:hypothetical protein [Spirosoma sp. KNUC1025]|uniref:hypothetical protein n=1 Tax=Spirosoma sp. KNUC1025 TaxID=2894082 RepID=UPI00386855FE|nr:hypothetical protein LN737_21295 [Spirosoma sp. KNUC1025]